MEHNDRVTAGKTENVYSRIKARVIPGKPEQSRMLQIRQYPR
jgi:hypothetical protein